MASLQWESESMPDLVTARVDHLCCAVRGSVAVIGGDILVGNQFTTTVIMEALSSREGAVFVSLAPQAVMWHDLLSLTVQQNHGGGMRQRHGAGAFSRRIGLLTPRPTVHGAAGGSCH